MLSQSARRPKVQCPNAASADIIGSVRCDKAAMPGMIKAGRLRSSMGCAKNPMVTGSVKSMDRAGPASHLGPACRIIASHWAILAALSHNTTDQAIGCHQVP